MEAFNFRIIKTNGAEIIDNTLSTPKKMYCMSILKCLKNTRQSVKMWQKRWQKATEPTIVDSVKNFVRRII